MSDRYKDFQQRYEESSDRFQEHMRQAILEHHRGVLVVGELMRAVGERETQLQASLDELKENDAELKRLIMEQGEQIRALRVRLDENGGAR